MTAENRPRPSALLPDDDEPTHHATNHDDDALLTPPLLDPSERRRTMTTPTSTTTAPMIVRSGRKLATFLYLITTALLFADQNLLAPNLSSIASEFGFDDDERDRKLGGEIAIAFFMVGLPASFVVGCLADVVRRRGLLFLFVVLVGEGACLATYFYATTFRRLYWCRALTGVSVGGALPLVYSVLGDCYEPRERGRASSAIGVGCGVGISIGQGVSGILGPRYGWRAPFLVISLPAMMFAILVWIFVPEVERCAGEMRALEHEVVSPTDDGGAGLGGNDEMSEFEGEEVEVEMAEGFDSRTTMVAGDAPDQGVYVQLSDKDSSGGSSRSIPGIARYCNESIYPHVQTLGTLLRCPSVLCCIFQGAPGCIPWGIINTYLNDYLSSDGGLTVEGATLIILVFGMGNFLGTIIGGIGCSHIYERYGRRYPAILSAGAAIAGCFPFWGMINYNLDPNERKGIIVLGTISLLAGILSGITGPIVKSTLQNVTMPQMRGAAFALHTTFDDLGRGLGPAFVAWMIVKLGGRRRAFNVGAGSWMVCGILNGLLFCTVEADEERVRLGVARLVAANVANERDSSDRSDHEGADLL